MDSTRAWAEVDLDALTANLAALRHRIGPATALILVAKADAYGHGAVAVAHHAARTGADAVAVTTCGEAQELLRAGVRTRLLVLGPAFEEEALEVVRAGVELCAPSHELLAGIEGAARRVGSPARVHAKVDTGMGRLGVSPAEAPALLATVRRSPHLELAGLMTHLAATEGAPANATHAQMRRFRALVEGARARGLLSGRDVWVHAGNSAAVLSGLTPLFDAVRVGIAAYGIAPDASLEAPELRPVLSVRTRVVHLRSLAIGENVGYGGTWTAPRRTRLAVLPVGYDDGVAWRLGNRGQVLVRGRRVPIVGRISMDYTTVDVTDVPGVGLGERVTLFGSDGDERLRVEEVAELAGTIPYELTCSLGRRVTRTYTGRIERESSAPVLTS